MTVRKIKNTWWVDFRTDHVRYRRRSPENSKPGAMSYEAALRHRLASGQPIVAPPEPSDPVPTFKQFAWTWFDDYVVPNNKFAEQRAKKGILTRHLVPFFGQTLVDSITAHQIERFKAEQVKAGVSNKSIRNRLTILHKCLSCAEEWLELPAPAPKIKWPKCAPPHTDYLSPEEAERLLNHAHGLTYEMVLTTLRTGMRQGEIKGLQWASIDWQSRTVAVRHSFCDIRKVLDTPKSNRVRHIPLDPEVFELLERRRQAEGHVFLDDGRPFNSTRLNRRLAKVCREAGLRPITWHALRHTFATSAAMQGVPLQIVQHLLGHSTVKTTERYAHVAPSMLRLAVDMLHSRVSRFDGQPVGNAWSALRSNEEKTQAA